MLNKETIKALGIKDYLIYNLLRLIELILNLPYIILKVIFNLLYEAFNKIDCLFYKRRIIVISRISKRANAFRIKCQSKVRKVNVK